MLTARRIEADRGSVLLLFPTAVLVMTVLGALVIDASLTQLVENGVAVLDAAGGSSWELEGGADEALLERLMTAVLELREAARGRKDFATADAIRDRLAEAGIEVRDGGDGRAWE